MANITRDEAQARAELLAVATYDIELDLTRGPETFSSTSTIAFTCREPGAGTFLEMIGEVHEVVLNGTSLDLADARSGDRILLADLAADNIVQVTADCPYSHSGEGLHRFVDPEDDAVYLYSQCAVYDAQRIFACFDQPDLKARFTVGVTADPEWTVLANTVPVQQDGGHVGFAATEPISTYLLAVCAGDYVGVHDEHDGIALGLWCRKALLEHLAVETTMTVTKQGLDYYAGLFGIRYPFGEKYDQVMVPEFNLGAMENPGCVTFREESFVHRSRVTDAERENLAVVVLHEMAHMWFGNLVTMTWWNDLWLNESFADYMGHRTPVEATRFTECWTTFCVSRKAQGYAADQRPTTHPIADDLPDLKSALLNFDGISYAKGASALKQLVAWIGDEAFFAGIRAYFTEHSWGSTRLADLLSALSESSGRDVAAWSEVWLEQAGVSTLRPQVTIAADGTYASVQVLQQAPQDHPTLRPHRIGLGVYDLRGDGLVRRLTVPVQVDGPVTDVPALVGQPAPELLLLNDGDLTFAKTRFDERSLATIHTGLGGLPDSMSRAVAWASLWDTVRDAELPVSSYVGTVIAALPAETHAATFRRVLQQTQTGIDLYATAEHRPPLLADLAAAASAQLRSTEPGGDAQLSWARCFVDAAADQDVPTLRDWLAGRSVPAGLVLDRELRWAVVGRLAVLGAVDSEQIDAERADDQSQSGELAAAYARSALPDAGNKAASWSALFGDGRLPNAQIERVCAGFWQPSQADVLRPYVERYFRDVRDLPERRTSWMVLSLVARSYPRTLVERATLAASTDFLGGELDTLLRRPVTEQHAELERALAARACDAG